MLFVATFLPFISPKTPLIRTTDLEFEKSKTRIVIDTEEIDSSEDETEMPISLANISRPYAQLMNNIISKRKMGPDLAAFSSKISPPRGIKSTPRTRESERSGMRS